MNTIKDTVDIKKRPYMAAMIGTALEYYDSSLYGFLVPLLTPLFLPNMDPVTAMIIGYSMYPLGMLSRPLGAFIIGRIGDRHGRRKALMISITGTAVATGLIGFLPTYETIGVMAPILLAVLRLTQKFFVAGEYNGGAIFAMEHSEQGKGFRSGLYCAFTVSGILVAAGVVAIVAYLPEGWWRMAYFLAFLTGLYGLYLRKQAPETPEFDKTTEMQRKLRFKEKFELSRPVILKSIFAAGFFASLYMTSSVFMNGFVPKVTDITEAQVLTLNVVALGIYMIALPYGGKLGDILGFRRSMSCAIMATVALAYPLMLMLHMNSLFWVGVMKVVFALLNAWYVGPFHAWIQSLYPVNTRYQFISMTYSLGSQLGSIATPLSFWLWQQTGFVPAASVFIIGWGVLALYAVLGAKPLELTRGALAHGTAQ